MSTRTWTQEVYDKHGRLVGHFHHTDVSTPTLRTQQRRQAAPRPVYTQPGQAALACKGCGWISCRCDIGDGNLTVRINEQIRLNRAQD